MISTRIHRNALSRRRGFLLFAAVLVAFWTGWATVHSAGRHVYVRVTTALLDGINEVTADNM